MAAKKAKKPVVPAVKAPAHNTKKKAAATTVANQQLQNTIRSLFPSYVGWTTGQLTEVFGQDLVNVILMISDPKNGINVTTERGRQRVKALLQQTNYWNNTASAVIEYDQMSKADRDVLLEATKSRIANQYGDLGLDDATLSEIAVVVARNKLTDLAEGQAVYSAALRVGAAAGVIAGEDAATLRNLAKSYGYKATDAEIKLILTGQKDPVTGQVMTADSYRQKLRNFVKATMPHLAPQIDSGLTLDDLGKPYRQYAAQLLERSEADIDMMSGPYLRAFGSSQTGPMGLSDWIQTIKSDPTYGWQYTKQANDQATSIALSLARAFGKVQ